MIACSAHQRFGQISQWIPYCYRLNSVLCCSTNEIDHNSSFTWSTKSNFCFSLIHPISERWFAWIRPESTFGWSKSAWSSETQIQWLQSQTHLESRLIQNEFLLIHNRSKLNRLDLIRVRNVWKPSKDSRTRFWTLALWLLQWVLRRFSVWWMKCWNRHQTKFWWAPVRSERSIGSLWCLIDRLLSPWVAKSSNLPLVPNTLRIWLRVHLDV